MQTTRTAGKTALTRATGNSGNAKTVNVGVNRIATIERKETSPLSHWQAWHSNAPTMDALISVKGNNAVAYQRTPLMAIVLRA